MELQLLPDEELLDIWEQTQRAAWALEEKGWDSATAQHYSGIIVWEMQRRLSHLPHGKCFGSGKAEPVESREANNMPRIVTVRI